MNKISKVNVNFIPEETEKIRPKYALRHNDIENRKPQRINKSSFSEKNRQSVSQPDKKKQQK